MGYYTQQQGTVTIDSRDEKAAVEAMKALNHNHDDKQGKRSPRTGDPYADFWYSWMPERYHEDDTLTTVGDVLAMLGYDVSRTEEGTAVAYRLFYDNKTGQEDVFLNRLADFATILVDVTGEDGERWRWTNQEPGRALMLVTPTLNWDHAIPVTQQLYRKQQVIREMDEARL